MGVRESEILARDYFSTYYSNWYGQAPERLQAREIGFIPFFGTMSRHRKISSIKEMEGFVKSMVPRHLYYSSAYYRKPDEKRMQDKEWMGAELIFDLDADHISTVKKLSYEETLNLIRQHTIRLIEKFLLGDMGFLEDEIRIFFSGGRGYHVHVLSDRVYSMTSDSRREIASYIKGEGLNLEDFVQVNRTIPSNHGGWAQEVTGALLKTLAERASRASSQAQLEISSLKTAGVNTHKAAVKTIEDVKRSGMAEIDDPVTTDVHRLIRYPGSLHGKTGFQVSEVSLDELRDFNPLSVCIPDVFREGEAKVEVNTPFSISLLENKYHLRRGESTFPLFVALYAVLSNQAQFILNID